MTTQANNTTDGWIRNESGFNAPDHTRLFYRTWQPREVRPSGAVRALVFLHRGHEHSGRIEPLVKDLGYQHDWAFAWDARGHGYSPGDRGDAPDFQTLVEDLEAFIRHIQQNYGIETSNMLLVANSVGAVIAATWLHDYATKVRGVVMAAPAFEINLYVPLAKPALRLGLGFQPQLAVTSYIRPGMLTHSTEEAHAYGADPLIAKRIAARVLLDLADTSKRIVQTANAVDTPVLILAADQDYVVKVGPQKRYFDGLSSNLKRLVLLKNCRHAIFYEDATVRNQAIEEAKGFIDASFASSVLPPKHYHLADISSPSAQQYQALENDLIGPWPMRAFFALQRFLLGTLGRSSQGMQIGHTHGFDSGASFDYVYGNEANGRWGIGKLIDRGYLDAVGWRGIRQRKAQMQEALSGIIKAHPKDQTLRILDIAAGGGRYVLETAKRFQGHALHMTLRDYDEHNLSQATQLAQQLGLHERTETQLRDAFLEESYADGVEKFDVAIVSGLYELFPDNARILRSLRGLASQLKTGGHLIYTGQPWHPQLVLIAKTLTSHTGKPWRMRPRPQAEMDGLVESVGLSKVATHIGLQAIFTVSIACKN